MARVREQQGCCARAHRDVLTASLGTLVQWPSSPIEHNQNTFKLLFDIEFVQNGET
ncbi:hypothetical protein [Shewanella denitrificans]|jgi:hypothetical protein|uniref:hypothetical protein n=1 Tax=Shewanella denitrificans TaxID=192073 RepID=UPI00030EB097|nr:hypothetical protein [Shewanella denitrificans]